jgi:ATP-dependent DNA helicase RecG
MIGFNTSGNIVENIVEKAAEIHYLGKTQGRIFQLMLENPKISAKAIAAEIGIAPRNVQTHIPTLKKAGLVEQVGPAKGGRWIVKK